LYTARVLGFELCRQSFERFGDSASSGFCVSLVITVLATHSVDVRRRVTRHVRWRKYLQSPVPTDAYLSTNFVRQADHQGALLRVGRKQRGLGREPFGQVENIDPASDRLSSAQATIGALASPLQATISALGSPGSHGAAT
jgi:hypothetical protein